MAGREPMSRGMRSALGAVAAIAGALVVAAGGGCGRSTSPAPPNDGLGPVPDPLVISAPGFPAMPVPPDNPTTRQGVELGRHLFYDPILSGDSTMSCASCHAPEFAFTDHGKRVSRGIRGFDGRRNAPSLTNIGWNQTQFWEGRRLTLEQQAGDPVPAHDEMDLPWADAVRRLQRSASYPALFRAAFRSADISQDRAVKAIAQFERTFVSVNSPYDRFLRGAGTLTASERHGYVLFFTEKADCFHCHVNNTFTDFGFQNNGLDSIFVDPGRSAVTFDDNDVGKFKTPTLRNIVFTAPYMHDGRFATLEEVLDHYDSHAKYTPTVNPFIRVNGRTLGLSPQDKLDVIAFLKTLTDSSFVNNPSLRSPF
jgi:cytochrome c peroxidase